MKKIFGILIAMVVLCATFAMAGEIGDLQYNDKSRRSGWWWQLTDEQRTIYDYDVWVNADLLNGMDFDQMIYMFDDKYSSWELYYVLKDNVDRIDAKPDQVGGGGIGRYELAELLGLPNSWWRTQVNGSFKPAFDYLPSVCMPLEDVYTMMERLQAQINLLSTGKNLTEYNIMYHAGMLKAQRVGHRVSVNGHICYRDMCIKPTVSSYY